MHEKLSFAVDHSDSNPPKMRLECVRSWRLNGCVQSLAKVRLANSPRDALLLSFLDAKLSVVEYDPETHDLKTVSLHIFEVREASIIIGHSQCCGWGVL